MSLPVVVYVLTVLAGVVVALTRLPLDRAGAVQHEHGGALLRAHAVLGALAMVLWTTFLVAPADTVPGGSLVGILAVGLWWMVALVGLLLLTRWLPSKGRHAAAADGDPRGRGPGLSVLAHGGVVVSVAVFTWAYLTAAV